MPNYKSKYKGSQIDGLLDFVNDNKNNIAMQSDIPTVPNKTSDLNNDSNFIDNTVNNLVNYYLKTETYTQSEINTLISAAASGGFVKVNELPTENINVKAIYLVPYTGSRAKNLYEEYIYVDSDWEMIGTTKIDLSNYVTITALNIALADYVLTTDLTPLLNAKQDKMQFETMPTASADYLEKIVQYVGLTTNDYHNGRFYKCVTDGTDYSWEEQSGGVSDFNELSNRPQKEVTSIQSLIDPVPLPSHAQIGSVGFTPIGTIISVMGTTAPRHYLTCDGSEYNITDYPELTDYFEEQFGTINHFGGDGETTFAVPDLRGEFLRGTGTNGHTNQGSGANVGVHQDGTTVTEPFTNAGSNICLAYNGWTQGSADSIIKKSAGYANATASKTTTTTTYPALKTVRPTNTSVLYCIATKNIYVDAKFDYSTQEKVIGTWIDGKPLYQITVYIPHSSIPNKNMKQIPVPSLTDIDVVVSCSGMLKTANSTAWTPLPRVQDNATDNNIAVDVLVSSAQLQLKGRGYNLSETFNYGYCTIQYTKTTD